MCIEKLTINHQELLRDRLKSMSFEISEYTFASLYLFRDKHNYRVIFDDEIFISGTTYDGINYIMPLFDLSKSDSEYVSRMSGKFGMLFPIPEEWLSALDPGVYDFSVNDNDSDYIHTVNKMINFSGKHLHGQKNLLSRFTDTYHHERFPLAAGRLTDAMKILNSWNKTASENTDYRECMEAIDLYEKLNLCGGIFYADHEPAGFIIGEELNDKTFVLHFVKGRREFAGVYQYMFNSFAKIMPSKYCCFNLEQDLGLDSLRNAKMSYKPERMIRKYRVSLR
jgi:hypothetical protein